MAKQPFHQEIPSGKKYPRGAEKAQQVPDLISWHVRTVDKEGSWGWEQITRLIFDGILTKMSNFETMKWSLSRRLAQSLVQENHHPRSIHILAYRDSLGPPLLRQGAYQEI